MTPPPYPSAVSAVAVAIGAASHLGEVDAAAVQALHEVALRVDERRPGDNVSLPTFLKLVDALALTPLARRALVSVAGGKASDDDGSAGDGGDARGAEPSEFERRRRAAQAKLAGKASG